MANIRFLMLWAKSWQTYVKRYSPKHRKHPRLDAVVWYSRFTTFAEKLHIYTQRNKCFSGLIHSYEYASGHSSSASIGTQ